MTAWKIRTIPVTHWMQNCTLVHPDGGGPSVIVDPGGDWDRISRAIDDAGAQVEAILLTHGHIDHIGGIPDAVGATGAPTYLHPDDLWLFDDPGMGMFPQPPVPVPDDLRHVSGGETFGAAGLSFEVLFTPGHSPGHVCYVLRDGEQTIVLGGDLVFAGSIGRTDLPGGDLSTLVRSVQEKLWPLPDDTTILPGHGPPTTVGAEKQINPYVGLHVIGDLLP